MLSWDVRVAGKLTRLIPLLAECVAIVRENRGRFAPVVRSPALQQRLRIRQGFDTVGISRLSGRHVRAQDGFAKINLLATTLQGVPLARRVLGLGADKVSARLRGSQLGLQPELKPSTGPAALVDFKVRSSRLDATLGVSGEGLKAVIPRIARSWVRLPVHTRHRLQMGLAGPERLTLASSRLPVARRSFAPRSVNAKSGDANRKNSGASETGFPVAAPHSRLEQAPAQIAAGGQRDIEAADRISARRPYSRDVRRDGKVPDFDNSLDNYFVRLMRLPPSGMTGHDPRLSPTWAGLQIPG